MDIIDKLKYYTNPTHPKKDTNKKSNLHELADKLGGFVFEENSLPLIKRETIFSFNQLQINNFTNSIIKLPVLTKGDFSEPIKVHDLLFFDLETTGLAGGTGTYPFLIGIAFFEKKKFKIIQYFLPEYDRDIYAYLDIKKYTKNKSILGSYNGKSYDYPLLKNRFILNKFDDIFEKFNHIDLLHLSRRIWKSSLDNCSLGNIEQKIFKFSRFNDIEGYLIPHTYFEYLQSGNDDDIVNIILHNEQDLISLGRLIFLLSELEDEEKELKISNKELISLFDTAIKSNSFKKSEYYFKQIKKRKAKIPNKVIFNYSILLKRNNKWNDCIKIWEKLLQSENYTLLSFEEIAKYYEHRIIDIEKAKSYTKRALAYIDVTSELEISNVLNNIRKNFQHRLNRLQSKL